MIGLSWEDEESEESTDSLLGTETHLLLGTESIAVSS